MGNLKQRAAFVSSHLAVLASHVSLGSGLCMSACVETRKMVNYVWIGWSQGKLWWKLETILTCKSIVKSGY